MGEQRQRPDASWRADASERAGAVAVALLLLWPLLRLSQDPATVNHDVSWLLYVGGRLLDGDRYGIDIVEVNPPLILWVSSSVAALSRLVAVQVELCWNLLTFAGVLLTSLAVYRLLRPHFANAALLYGVALLLAPLQLLVCDYDFGQREHLIFLLMAPQILIAALSPGGEETPRTARSGAAVCTALAVALKPHYALVWAGTECISAWQQGRLRLVRREETWLIAALGSVYVASVFAALPEYRRIAEQTLAAYAAYDRPVPLVSWRTAPVAAAVVAALALRPRGSVGRAVLAVAGAGLASFACVFIQGKNYPYHYLPAQLFAALAILLALAGRLDPLPVLRRRSRNVARIGLAASFALASVFAFQGFRRVETDRRAIVALIREQSGGRPVLFLSASVSDAFPVIPMAGARSASPYSNIWQIAGHYDAEELARGVFPYRAREDMPPLEREVLTTIVDRMERERPGLIFFDIRRYQQGFGTAVFAWDRYLDADPRFRGLMAGYRSVGVIGRYYAVARVAEPSGS